MTKEQRDVIRALFGHYDWTLDELNDGNNTENNSSENNNQNTSNAAEREGNNDPVSGSVDDDNSEWSSRSNSRQCLCALFL